MTTYFDLLPCELVELIYEKKHKAEMKKVFKKYKERFEDLQEYVEMVSEDDYHLAVASEEYRPVSTFGKTFSYHLLITAINNITELLPLCGNTHKKELKTHLNDYYKKVQKINKSRIFTKRHYKKVITEIFN